MVYARSVHDYFKGDFGHLSVGAPQQGTFMDTGEAFEFQQEIRYDGTTHTLFMTMYLGPDVPRPLDLVRAIVSNRVAAVRKGVEGVEMTETWPSEPSVTMSTAAISPRVYAYVDRVVAESDRVTLERFASEQGAILSIRDRDYVERRVAEHSGKRPIAFISHDSRDKPEVAQPLHLALMQGLLKERIWYDQTELHVGSRLRDSIEAGLKECENCILMPLVLDVVVHVHCHVELPRAVDEARRRPRSSSISVVNASSRTLAAMSASTRPSASTCPRRTNSTWSGRPRASSAGRTRSA